MLIEGHSSRGVPGWGHLLGQGCMAGSMRRKYNYIKLARAEGRAFSLTYMVP